MSLEDKFFELIKEMEKERHMGDKRAEQFWNLIKDLTPIATLKESTTPANPASGYMKVYFKSDGMLYSLDPNGNERAVSSSANEIVLQTDQTPQDDLDFVMTMTGGGVCVIDWGDDNSSYVSGGEATYSHHYGATGTYNIRIYGNLNKITKFDENNNPISGDIATFAKATSLTNLQLYNTSVSGDIANLSGLTSLIYIQLQDTSVSGDIANLSGLTSLVVLYLYNTSVSGDISNLSGLTSLAHLRLQNTSVSGDIANLSGLTSLAHLYLYNTSVSGDISNLSGLTSLTYLQLHATSVSGDISNLSGLTSLTVLALAYTSVNTYTQGVLPDWDACDIYIHDLGLSQQEVDDFLCDLDTASTASTKTLDISGTNSAPSGVGLDCKGSLEGKGWTVTVSA